jgi:hypothetical protein
MGERFAVVFQAGSARAAGALEIQPDRLRLQGRGGDGILDLEIRFSDLSEIRVGRRPSERLYGYATLVLERATLPPVRVAPLATAVLPEIVSLVSSLNQNAGADLLAVRVPLRPGCLGRARILLAKGPPFDPSSLGLSSHQVYLSAGEAIFVFRGSNVRARVGEAIRHPAIWRAGLAWQRCFAAPPQIVPPADLSLDADPAYHWVP